MIVIDGSEGEGGGQILRTALSLAMVTGQPFRIDKIRARRSKPGILRQHLTAIQAATAVSGAEVEGAAIGSRELSFTPHRVRAGDYRLAVGTAGSTTLVLQTVLPALIGADAPSTLVLEGGTHNPMAPPFDFLARAFLPVLARLGPKVEVRLERPGFYPAGGGRLSVSVTPRGKLAPVEILDRGAIAAVRAKALVANLPVSIANRELSVIGSRLGLGPDSLQPEVVKESVGPGNVVTATCRARR